MVFALNKFPFFNFSNCLDSSTPWQLGFQDTASPVMEGIVNLHHDLMFFITFILFFVLVVIARTLYYFTDQSSSSIISRSVVHGTTIEVI
jgi:cytochrome c oxidase subunit 2